MGNERGEGQPRPWERLSTREVAEYEMFRVREDRSRSPRDGEVHDFQVAVSPGGVAVLALTDDGRLVMVEQFRHGTRDLSLELPSGVVDDGEAPEEAARRELREETGFEGGEPRVLGCFELNPSWQKTAVHAVLVPGAKRAGEKDEDEGEDIRVRLLPVAEVRRKVLAGEIDAAPTLCALALWGWRGGKFSA
ncbi:MAG TPA: NUDIX hydrolase [Longimicrobium sp.]|jgi:8-oxo-dGTP pyrophosphatase MutT (NUDIX family)|nr:NUDIX hydrolase [Longimicrobium sp.]